MNVQMTNDAVDQRSGIADSHVDGKPADPDSEAGTPPSNTSGSKEEQNHSRSNTEVRMDHSSDDAGEQVLVERDGKFRMVNTDDVMAEDDVRSRSSSTSSDAALRVSSMSIKTANGRSRGRTTGQQSAGGLAVPRSKSAVSVPGPRRSSIDRKSTHRLSEEQKRQLEKQQARRAEQAVQEEERRKELEEKKRMVCNACLLYTSPSPRD